MTRILLDQGLPRSSAALLRDAGWEALHVGECGLSSARDEAILDFAREHRYIVCTLDADFHALLALSGAAAPSVIRIRREGLKAPDVAALLQAIQPRVQAALDRGVVISVTDRALRFRYLPAGGVD